MKPIVLATLLLGACSHTSVLTEGSLPLSKPSDTLTVGPRPPESSDERTWAEPIAPELVRSYPHLAPHVGQLLLGDDTVQFILGGMPAGAAKDHVLFEAAFVRSPQGWEKQVSAGPTMLRFAQGKEGSTLTGFDRDITPDAAKWVFTFKSGDTTWPLDVRFDRMTRIVIVRFPKEAPAAWQLRWNATASDVTPLPDDVTKRPGVARGFVARGGTDPVALQAFSPLGLQHKGDLLELAPARGPKADATGFFVFAGPASAHLGWSLAAEKSCRKPPSKDKNAPDEEERFLTCWMNRPYAWLVLNAPEEEPPTASLRRRLTLFADRTDPLPLAIHPGSRVVARVPSGQKTLVFERRRGDDQRITETTLESTQMAELNLAPRDIGKATIHLRRKEARITQPVFVTLAAAAPHGRDALTPLLSDDAARPLSPWHAWVDRWPRTFSLPAGRYDLEISHRLLGKPCRLALEVVGDRENEWTCSFEKDPGSDKEVIAVSADFVELWGKEREKASAHFGLSLYRVVNQQNAASEAGAIFVVEVEDPVQGYGAQIVSPSDELLANLGSSDALSRPHAVESLARAFRNTGASGLFVLGCPTPGVSAVEYARLVNTVRPDAIQVLGCGPAARERELMMAAAVPFDADTAPILLPAATFSRTEPRQAPLLTSFPRDAFPLTPRPLTISDWLPLMRAGRYGWARDATLLVKPQDDGQLATRRGRNIAVRFEARTDVSQSLRLVLLNEKGVIHERHVKPEELTDLRADIPIRADRHWFRAELRSTHPQKTSEEVVLAGTGWIKLASPIKPKG